MRKKTTVAPSSLTPPTAGQTLPDLRPLPLYRLSSQRGLSRVSSPNGPWQASAALKQKDLTSHMAVISHCYQSRTKWELNAIPGQWVVIEATDEGDPHYVWARIIAGHSVQARDTNNLDNRGWIHHWYLHVIGRVQDGEADRGNKISSMSANKREFAAKSLREDAESMIRSFYQRMCSLRVVSFLSMEPFLVRFGDFLDHSTCKILIDAANEQGFSLDKAGVVGTDHPSARTSEGQWLYPNPCPSANSSDCNSQTRSTRTTLLRGAQGDNLNRAIRAVEAQVAAVSRQPCSHQEPLHVVRYRPGQEYRPHMDAIDEHNLETYGPRISTVLIYLNNNFEGDDDGGGGGGGCTHFVDLDISIHPTAGAAIFWHNVRPPAKSPEISQRTYDQKSIQANSSVAAAPSPLSPSREISHLQPDCRTTHAAKSISSGEKYVAIKWIHANPFR